MAMWIFGTDRRGVPEEWMKLFVGNHGVVPLGVAHQGFGTDVCNEAQRVHTRSIADRSSMNGLHGLMRPWRRDTAMSRYRTCHHGVHRFEVVNQDGARPRMIGMIDYLMAMSGNEIFQRSSGNRSNLNAGMLGGLELKITCYVKVDVVRAERIKMMKCKWKSLTSTKRLKNRNNYMLPRLGGDQEFDRIRRGQICQLGEENQRGVHDLLCREGSRTFTIRCEDHVEDHCFHQAGRKIGSRLVVRTLSSTGLHCHRCRCESSTAKHVTLKERRF